jgi:predicted esterase YcpF (UPF0227 family)
MGRTKKNSSKLPGLLYLGGGFMKSECGKFLSEYKEYKYHTRRFDYDNYYIANGEITEYVLDNEINIVVGEGLGGFFAMFLSNENVPEEHPIISRIFINPSLQPAEDLNEIEIGESVTNTYKTIETNVYRQKYLDMRHSICIFSKNNPAIKYAETFTKKTGIKSIVLDTIDEEFIFTNLHDIINAIAVGKDITKYINK